MNYCGVSSLIAAAILLNTGSSSSAADQTSSRTSSQAQWPAGMKTCAALRNETERLNCYDRLAAALQSDALAQQPELSPENMFGVQGQLSRESAPQQPADRRQIHAITAQVTALSQSADGSLVIGIDNGQTWRQEEGGALMLTVGDTVIISRAAMSSFRLSTPTRRYARVKRVR